jgi:UDP-glucose:(heptosyl)LPS alpha-1,3-glucosyltransferase
MRIALTLQWFDPSRGGEAIWTRGFAEHLLASGHEVHVVAFGFGDHGLSMPTHVVARCWSPLLLSRRFRQALNEIDPDAVYDTGVTIARGLWHPHAGSNLHSLDRHVATEPPRRRLRAALSPKLQLQRAQMFLLEQAQARQSLRIAAVSPLVRALLETRHPQAAGKITTVMNGTDTAYFDPEALYSLRAAARQAIGIGDEVLFLTVAHNPPLKGVDTAFRALSQLVHQGLPVHLAFAGAEGVAWRRLAATLGIERRVTFHGLVGDMRPVYAAADVLVHPTRWDACSLVVLEALARGLPVITTRRNGAVAAIRDGESGLVLEAVENPDRLAELMRTICDPAVRSELAANARRAVLAHDIRANYQAIEALLYEVSGTARGG